MDNEAFKTDLRRAAKLIPPDLLRLIGEIAINHMDEVGKVFPVLIETMGPHVRSIAFENSMGMLDKDGLDAAMKEVFTEAGIKIPDAKSTEE